MNSFVGRISKASLKEKESPYVAESNTKDCERNNHSVLERGKNWLRRESMLGNKM